MSRYNQKLHRIPRMFDREIALLEQYEKRKKVEK
jgi:hypothetical protein